MHIKRASMASRQHGRQRGIMDIVLFPNRSFANSRKLKSINPIKFISCAIMSLVIIFDDLSTVVELELLKVAWWVRGRFCLLSLGEIGAVKALSRPLIGPMLTKKLDNLPYGSSMARQLWGV